MAVHDDLLTAASQQLNSPETPYVLETHLRLTEEGIDAEEALQMIAHCLADELDALQSEGREFSVTRYQTLLSLLPTLPES